MSYLNLSSIRFCTEAEGPGKRIAIWVQGCKKRCLGCCNPNMQELKKNIIVNTKDLIKLIEKSIKRNKIEGLSFIGGEPMLQAEGLSDLAKWAKDKNLTIITFTGYLKQELEDLNNYYINELLRYTDILIDGPFIKELYDEKRDWVGSSNQKVYFLSKAYTPGIEYEKKEHQVEILVSEKDIFINGWPYDI